MSHRGELTLQHLKQTVEDLRQTLSLTLAQAEQFRSQLEKAGEEMKTWKVSQSSKDTMEMPLKFLDIIKQEVDGLIKTLEDDAFDRLVQIRNRSHHLQLSLERIKPEDSPQ